MESEDPSYGSEDEASESEKQKKENASADVPNETTNKNGEVDEKEIQDCMQSPQKPPY